MLALPALKFPSFTMYTPDLNKFSLGVTVLAVSGSLVQAVNTTAKTINR
jgi:hypothetical protein